MDEEQLEKMRIGREKAKNGTRIAKTPTMARSIRLKCLDCSSTSKMVKYCEMDGFNSTKCDLWPYRFGTRPETAIARHGEKFLNPKEMPDANTCVDDLP